MVITLDNDQLVTAKASEAYSMCLWGMPKMTVICGHCSGLFKTRDYLPHTKTREAIAHCPYCNHWNQTGLEMY